MEEPRQITSVQRQQGYSPMITQQAKQEAIQSAVQGNTDLLKETVKRSDISNVEEVKAVVGQYIDNCSKVGLMPNFMGVAAALGLSRVWLYQYLREHSNSESAQYLNQLRHAFASIRISLAERGILDPAICIFTLRNSKLGLSNTPEASEQEESITFDADREPWAYGLSDEEYAAERVRRFREYINMIDDEPDEQNGESNEKDVGSADAGI